MERFFKKINYDNTTPFDETDVEKVVVHKLDAIWDVHLINKCPISIED